MVNVTFSVPEKAHKIMKLHSEIRWTEIARKPVLKLVEKLDENEMNIVDIVREIRQQEDKQLMEKAGGDIDKAVKLWEKQLKAYSKKQKLPKWWKNATSPL